MCRKTKKGGTELQEKDAYYFLFNAITDLRVQLAQLQQRAEAICIAENQKVDDASQPESDG